MGGARGAEGGGARGAEGAGRAGRAASGGEGRGAAGGGAGSKGGRCPAGRRGEEETDGAGVWGAERRRGSAERTATTATAAGAWAAVRPRRPVSVRRPAREAGPAGAAPGMEAAAGPWEAGGRGRSPHGRAPPRGVPAREWAAAALLPPGGRQMATQARRTDPGSVCLAVGVLGRGGAGVARGVP